MSVRKSVRVAAKEAMQKHGYDPLDVLVLYAMDDKTAPESKLKIAETLLPYMYPKLSNITVEGEIVSNTTADSQAALLRRVLDDPELADAAQKLSIAASMIALESDSGTIQ